MSKVYFSGITIKKVRHLSNIEIPLGDDEMKHLIFTGKNGSGKTSVLEALKKHIEGCLANDFQTEEQMENLKKLNEKDAAGALARGDEIQREHYLFAAKHWENCLTFWQQGVVAKCISYADLRSKYAAGEFIVAYFSADRRMQMDRYNNIEHVEHKEKYSITENPGRKLAKYLVNLKATQAFARQNNEQEKAEEIEKWFERFEGILREVFADESVKLKFDINNFQFTIEENGRLPFDFNSMSSGYASIFDIINDLIMRMEKHKGYDLDGIVMIDEIETHLHLSLQKTIMPILTKLFPNIQFIITTHSPFILSSVPDAVVYDLENKVLSTEGFAGLPYEGIVKSYFDVDSLGILLRRKFERYKILTQQVDLSDAEYEELDSLEYYLDKIPDYLAPGLTTEYNMLKLAFANKEDLDG